MDGQLHLVARIAGQRVAIAADAIESVTEVASAGPVPGAAAHIAGLAALRSRVMTLIDCAAAIGLPRGPAPDARPAVVLAWDGHLYGLLVDGIEDVTAIEGAVRPARAALAPGWARVSRGLLDHQGAALVALDPAALIAGPDAAA